MNYKQASIAFALILIVGSAIGSYVLKDLQKSSERPTQLEQELVHRQANECAHFAKTYSQAAECLQSYLPSMAESLVQRELTEGTDSATRKEAEKLQLVRLERQAEIEKKMNLNFSPAVLPAK